MEAELLSLIIVNTIGFIVVGIILMHMSNMMTRIYFSIYEKNHKDTCDEIVKAAADNPSGSELYRTKDGKYSYRAFKANKAKSQSEKSPTEYLDKWEEMSLEEEVKGK